MFKIAEYVEIMVLVRYYAPQLICGQRNGFILRAPLLSF